MNEMESFEGLKKRIKELESQVNEIKANNERQEKILSSLDTGLCVINSDFTISWANQKIQEMFPDAEPIGQICHRFYESSDVPCEPCPTLQCFKSGRVHSIEKYNPAKESWYSIISQPVKDSNGEVVSVLEGITDITERKEEEKKIYQERSFLKQLLEISPVAITLVDREGYISMANARAEEVLGLKRSNIYSRRYNDPQWHITDFEGNEYPEEQLPFQMVQKKAGPVYGIEHAIVWADGKKVLLSINAAPVFDREGNFTGMITAMEDVTERRKAEQKNIVSRMRLDISHKIATMPDVTEKEISDFVLEKILELSGSHIGFIGYVSPDENQMIIHNWSNSAMAECVLHEKPISFPIDEAGIWGEAIRTREPIIINDYNEFHPSKTGYPEGHVQLTRFMVVPVFDGERIVAVSAVGNKPVAYQEYDPRQLMLLMESWWKQIQKIRWEKDKQTLQAKMSQVQKMESIGSLAGGIAHDFNNILFPILGISELMIDDFGPGSPEHESLKAIMNAGKRGKDLVQQILAIGRQSEQQPIPVQIQMVLKEVLKLIRSTTPANVHIAKDIQKDCGAVTADPTQLHQIAMNLITNASHAIEDDLGEIAVRLKEVDLETEDFIRENMEPGRYAMLTVSDTGSGISPDIMDKLFDPYFTTKEQGKGTGLGLSVVHGIVKSYGGEIKVYSELGQGTSFHVYLPVIHKTAEIEETGENRPLPTGNERILVVDDEAPIIRLEEALLTKLGYEVTSRTGSIDALEQFKMDPFKFDLVLTDMSMPNMTGEKLAKELISIRPDIPVILCTGFSERIDEQKAEDIGAKAFLKKPVVNRDMAQTVRKVLDEKEK